MRRAVYAGSFDPVTNGHLEIIEKAARLFDELIVAIGVNPDKRPLFPLSERVAMLTQVTSACVPGTSQLESSMPTEGKSFEFVPDVQKSQSLEWCTSCRAWLLISTERQQVFHRLPSELGAIPITNLWLCNTNLHWNSADGMLLIPLAESRLQQDRMPCGLQQHLLW